jgi:hypothetical protein
VGNDIGGGGGNGVDSGSTEDGDSARAVGMKEETISILLSNLGEAARRASR